MDNQHKLITGYRDLSEDEVNLMNEIKKVGEELGRLCRELEAMPQLDKRWVAIGTTDLQKGIMSLVRSVAIPNSF